MIQVSWMAIVANSQCL